MPEFCFLQDFTPCPLLLGAKATCWKSVGWGARVRKDRDRTERENSDGNKHNALSVFCGPGKVWYCTAISDLQIKRLRVRKVIC